MADITNLRRDLYLASLELANVNLIYSAKWCTEALNGLAPLTEPFDWPHLELSEEEKIDQFSFMLAKTYFNCKEFDRASVALKDAKLGNAVFLKLYALYISIDKRGSGSNGEFLEAGKDDVLSASSSKESAEVLDGKMGKLVAEVETYYENGGSPNAFLYFLEGMIYAKKKKFVLAQKSLVQSLVLFPYNWSCWQELLSTFLAYDDAQAFSEQIKQAHPEISENIMFQFFEIVVLQEFYQRLPQFLEKVGVLAEIFPTFTFLKVQKFLAAYHGLDYFQAEAIFDDILVLDPMRLDDLDTYSNMLYVMEKKLKLSFLAQFASQIDQYRSETCCVIANYHSMKGEHDKSIMYYKRALTLNKNCLSAWTLMGHEFVELKNSHAAIESYRRAVDINAKDFRAWYGLGQAYEVLDMHLYALYYYQRATNLQPTDKRMWQAIGNCFEKIDKLEEALRSFKKALVIDGLNRAAEDLSGDYLSVEPHICYKLATISEKLGQQKETYRYMRICFEQEMEWGITDETSKARLWLARNALESHHFEEAYELAKEFSLNNAHDVGEARSIAKEARSRMAK